MSKQILRGDELQIWLDNLSTGAQTYCPMYATSHTVTITGNTVDIATKDHGFWGASTVGTITWEVTAECLATTADYDALFDAMIRKTRLKAYFAPVRNYSSNGLVRVGGDVSGWLPAAKGKEGYVCVTSLTVNANTGENSTYSITFTGQGALKSVDHSVTNTYIDVRYGVTTLQYNDYKIYNTINGNDAVMSIVASSDNSEGTWTLDHNGKIPEAIVTEIEDTYGDDEVKVRYYLSGNIIPAHMFQNINLSTFNGIFTNDVRVGAYAFAGADISSGVATITKNNSINYGDHAFDTCSSLHVLNGTTQSNISELNGLDYGDYAFRNVELEHVWHNQNPDPVDIGYGAFEGCERLSEFAMPEKVDVVGQDAFKGCDDITISFYQQHAPTCSNNSFGTVGQQHFKLHYVTSVADFLGDDEMSVYYPAATCDYQLV